jgi:hypothetical protein
LVDDLCDPIAIAGSVTMLRFNAIVVGVCLLIAGAMAAKAATVSSQGGTVLVSSGEGFRALTGPAQLAAGNQVMVRPGGVATIAYGSDCLVRVGSGVWLVQAAAPCAPGTREIDFTGRMNQQPPADPPPVDQEPPPEGGGLPGIDPVTGLVIGGVVVGGVVLGVVLSQDSNNNRPASP